MFSSIVASFLKMLLAELLKLASSWIDDFLFKRRVEKAANDANDEHAEAKLEQEVNERRRRSLDFLNRDRS